ncbi:AmpG family muropeptide MFS transporter [Dongshaea marina]|uniref:AmpG family muropeptide MFS transporter n=1 Tax=Dongshaea marina TaxID=2047966 RepID=UPI000D3E200B
MFALGFSSGLPLLLVFGTLSFWLREAGVSRSEIGFFSWVVLAYGFKWVWSPLVDRLHLPLLTRLLGRRRGWMLLSQLMIILALCGMALSDPTTHLIWFALCALLVSFSSATQDIVIDAFRIESGSEKLQAAMAAAYMAGYRLAMILAGAGALAIAAWAGSNIGYNLHGWQVAYFCMAGFMLVGVVTTLIAREPKIEERAIEQEEVSVRKDLLEKGYGRVSSTALAWLHGALYEPFADFFRRYGWSALLILALISTYRISDIVMGVMAYPFYVDMGFTKEQIATVTKVYGVIMILVGAGIGGILINKLGTLRILLAGAILTAATNLLYAWLSHLGPSVPVLTLVISLDNLSQGLATAAFITYLSSLTSVAFSATQYALFSSVMVLFPKFLAGFSGVYVDHFGYASFFHGTAMIGVPVVLLILWLQRVRPENKPVVSTSSPNL